MPSKMMKRGRPKGAELTVIGLLHKKTKFNKGLTPFENLDAQLKDRALLECFVSPLIAKKSLDGSLISADNLRTDLNLIPDLIKDSTIVDIHRIEKYFNDDAWMIALELISKEQQCEWSCPLCFTEIMITTDDKVVCARCFCWYHLQCESLKKKPKSRHWFCRKCLDKYI